MIAQIKIHNYSVPSFLSSHRSSDTSVFEMTTNSLGDVSEVTVALLAVRVLL